jgi:hypothetical protein
MTAIVEVMGELHPDLPAICRAAMDIVSGFGRTDTQETLSPYDELDIKDAIHSTRGQLVHRLGDKRELALFLARTIGVQNAKQCRRVHKQEVGSDYQEASLMMVS